MKVWIAYVDHSYEGFEVLSLHESREGAKAACEHHAKGYTIPGEMEWEEDEHSYSEGWGVQRYVVVHAEVKP